jgi:hypothetical protein
VFLDSFAGSLDDIPVKRQKDARYVLECLKRNPVFSVFDIESSALARTVDKLFLDGYILYKRDKQFPWVEVVVTKNGNDLLSSPQPSMTEQTNESP